jgi:hypothetical protein
MGQMVVTSGTLGVSHLNRLVEMSDVCRRRGTDHEVQRDGSKDLVLRSDGKGPCRLCDDPHTPKRKLSSQNSLLLR